MQYYIQVFGAHTVSTVFVSLIKNQLKLKDVAYKSAYFLYAFTACADFFTKVKSGPEYVESLHKSTPCLWAQHVHGQGDGWRVHPHRLSSIDMSYMQQCWICFNRVGSGSAMRLTAWRTFPLMALPWCFIIMVHSLLTTTSLLLRSFNTRAESCTRLSTDFSSGNATALYVLDDVVKLLHSMQIVGP